MQKIRTILIRNEIFAHLYAVDYFRKNKKDAASEEEELVTYYTQISTFSKRPKRSRKV